MSTVPKKRMLFVDDRSRRLHQALGKYSEEYDVTLCPNVPETLRLLGSQRWDCVSLDYDLNGSDYQDPEEPTCGMEIIRYIRRTGGWPFKERPVFILHSSNPFGRRMMTLALIKLGFKAIEERFEYLET